MMVSLFGGGAHAAVTTQYVLPNVKYLKYFWKIFFYPSRKIYTEFTLFGLRQLFIQTLLILINKSKEAISNK